MSGVKISMDDQKKPLLKVDNLFVQFTTGIGKKHSKVVEAVRGVSFEVNEGEKVAIVGESGSGKSTTAHAIINLLPGTGKVTGGSIQWSGHSDLHNDDGSYVELVGAKESSFVKLRGNGIGLVPQDPMSNLNPVWKIGFQVQEALRANGYKGNLKKRAAQLLEEAGLEDAVNRMKQYPHEFSGGMRQRALIAIGLANRPKLLIADEPTSALDVTVQKIILDHLNSLTDELGTAVLFITHDLGLAAERADKIVVMYKGEIVESGDSLEILKNPQHPYTKKLIAAAPSLAATRMTSSKASLIGQIEVDEKLHELHKKNVPDFNVDSIIEVYSLTKEFDIRGSKKKFKAVDNVSFSIEKGKTTAIVGESGSGKSTVANMVLGLLRPTDGKIAFHGRYMDDILHSKKETKNFRRQVQPVFQNPYGALDPMFSIARSIREPLDIHQIGDASSREKRVDELLDFVQLPKSVRSRYPNELSGGQRQRITIARALALNPDLIVLDEAVSALDVLVQQQILTLLNDLQAQFGLTYLFITHDLAVVRLVADGTIVMQNGKIVERGATEEIFSSPSEQYTKNLLDAIPGRHIM